MEKAKIFQEFYWCIIKGDKSGIIEISKKALSSGIDPLEAVEEGMMPAMKKVGNMFDCMEIYLPEMMMSANAWTAAMELLEPEIARLGKGRQKAGVVVIGTVQHDIHELGKNMVATLLKTSGFEVHDLGANVSPSAYVAQAEKVKADIIASSALMTTTMPYQKSLIDYLKAMGVRDKYFVMIGGGPTNQAWADNIGADGYGRTANEAVGVATALVGKKERG